MIQEGELFTLPNKYRVKQIAAAISNTFVILCEQIQSQFFSKLVHVRSDGSEIHTYHFQITKQNFFMVSSHQVIIALRYASAILLIDLIKQELKMFNIKFEYVQQKQLELKWFYFTETDITCLCESSMVNQKRHIKLNYFSGRQFSKPILTNIFQSKYTNYLIIQATIKKGNQHSLIIIQERDKGKIKQIDLYDIVYQHPDKKIRSRSFSIDGQLEMYPYINHFGKFQYWQFIQKELCVLIQSINGNQMFALSLENYELTFLNHKQPITFNTIIIGFVQNSICMWKQGGSIETFLYLLNGTNGMVTLKIPLNINVWQSIEQITYENSLLLKSSLNKYEQTIKLKKMRVVPVKQIYMQMLLHINQDFDDDLLMDAVDILKMQ